MEAQHVSHQAFLGISLPALRSGPSPAGISVVSYAGDICQTRDSMDCAVLDLRRSGAGGPGAVIPPGADWQDRVWTARPRSGFSPTPRSRSMADGSMTVLAPIAMNTDECLTPQVTMRVGPIHPWITSRTSSMIPGSWLTFSGSSDPSDRACRLSWSYYRRNEAL